MSGGKGVEDMDALPKEMSEIIYPNSGRKSNADHAKRKSVDSRKTKTAQKQSENV